MIMDTIRMKEMEFYGHTGCLPEEKANGQRFVVTCEIIFDSIRGKITDDLNDTCDYSMLYGRIKEIVENDRSDLIEHLAYKIADDVLKNTRHPYMVRVKVSKPDCPIDGVFDTMEVEIERAGE